MSGTTNAGPAPRTNRVEPNHDKTDVRCPCGEAADGVDARDGLPTCADCARLEADGGDELPSVFEHLRQLAGISMRHFGTDPWSRHNGEEGR